MARVLPALPLFYAMAAQAQPGAAEQPMDSVGPIAIWVFMILFFGAIIAFGWLTWRADRRTGHRSADAEPKRAGRA